MSRHNRGPRPSPAIDWSAVVWQVYTSPQGVRVEAPRVQHAPRGTNAHERGYYTLRTLKPAEMRQGERLTGYVAGVNRKAALARARAGLALPAAA